MDMNLNWALEHKNGSVTSKKDKQGKLNVYSDVRSGKHAKRDNVKTIALQDSSGKTVVLVDVPDGAEVFQRHRGGTQGVNYYNRFHTVNTWVDNATGEVKLTQVDNQQVQEPTITEVFDPATRRMIANLRKETKVLPEWTYSEFWLVGWRKRESDGTITVRFKALYPDGKIDEHNAWKEKPWLEEPEWLPEEQV
jgi:hypothetical protein